MNTLPIIPGFFRYNFIFLIVFFLITGLVSIFALKAHKITGKKSPQMFGVAFFIMAMGYFLRILFHAFELESRGMCKGCFRGMSKFSTLKPLMESLHLGFLLFGILILVYLSLKVKNKRLFPLLIGIVFLALISVRQPLGFFTLVSIMLYAFLVSFYYGNYKKHKQKETLIVLLSFTLLFLSSILLFFSQLNPLFFIVARCVELAGFIGILTNLILISKR